MTGEAPQPGPGGLVPGNRAAVALWVLGLVIAVVVDVVWWSSSVNRVFAALFTGFSVLVVAANFQLLIRGRSPFRGR